MKLRFSLLRALALFLCLLTLCTALCACASSNTVNAKKTVGTIDGANIYYDELYMLAHRYRATAEKAAAKNGTTVEYELDQLVRPAIVRHTAMIRHGEQLGLTYNEKDWKEQVDLEMTSILNNSFGGNQDAYRESLKKNALTERYVRYSLSVDLFYEQLLVEYPKQGLVVSDEDEVIRYINENFVHVYHLAFFFDESNREEKLARAKEARLKLHSGESMYSLIKKGYTEDFLDPSASGYYVTHGTMDSEYEREAFLLPIGGISEIVESKGYNNQNEYTSCFYILQRFEHDDAYVASHLNELQTEYYNSVIYADLEETQRSLSFAPNDFYFSLNLLSLAPPQDGLPTWALSLIIVGAVVVVGGGVTVAMILICKKPKKKQTNLEKVK